MEVRPGYKQSDLGIIPEDWDITTLGELGATFGGLSGKTKRDFGHGAARYITFMNIMTNVRIDCETFELVDVKPTETQNQAAKGDLFFNGSSETPGEVGMCAVLADDVQGVFLNSFCFGFRFREGPPADGLYLAYYFRSREGRELMKSLAQGAIRYNLSKTALLKTRFPLPHRAEQGAIADALSDTDALIDSLEQLLAKKRHLKQGALQDLITGKGRLPGFSGEWGTKRLGSVLRFQVGFPFRSAFFNEQGQGIRLVKNRDLKSDDQPSWYSGTFGQEYLVRDGDVLVGMDGDFSVCLWSKGPALLNQRVGKVVPLSGLDRVFAFYCLGEPLHQIENATSSTTVKHLSHGDVEGIEKALPSPEEQSAIAAILSDMDAEITALESRLAKSRQIKQGMMQQLLTGKTRLV